MSTSSLAHLEKAVVDSPTSKSDSLFDRSRNIDLIDTSSSVWGRAGCLAIGVSSFVGFLSPSTSGNFEKEPMSGGSLARDGMSPMIIRSEA